MRDRIMPDLSLPLVSILIPSFNHSQFIEKSIRSALGQTYENVEVIVVDDGSRDDTHGVLKSFPERDNLKIILNRQNKGQGQVLNQALDLARGDFISLLPSDDWYLPEKTQLQIEKFRTLGSEYGAVYGRGARYFPDRDETRIIDSELHRGDILEQLILKGNFVYPITPLFRRKCFDQFRFHTGYVAEGEAIYLRIATAFKYDFVEQVVGVMRDHPQNIGKNTSKMYRDNLRFWSEFFESENLPPNISKHRSFVMARLHCLKGMEFLNLRRDFGMARKALWAGFRARPGYYLAPKRAAALFVSFLPSKMASVLLDAYFKNSRI